MNLLWLLLVIALGLAGLPWFAALGLTLLLMSAVSGLDSLLLILEFGRLLDFQMVLAVPALLMAARVLLLPAPGCAPHNGLRVGVKDWSGSWLLAFDEREPRRWLPATALLPGVPLLVVWMVLTAISPARTPGLQALWLAAVVPAGIALLGAVCLLPRLRRELSDALMSLRWQQVAALIGLLLIMLGLYGGRWGVFEASAAVLVFILVARLRAGHLGPDELRAAFLLSFAQFGRFVLLFGLSLAWAAMLFDNGLDRQWLRPLADLLAGSPAALILPGLWLSAVWVAAAWKLGPLPALLITAPWLVSAALQIGIPAPALAMLALLSLSAGQSLSTQAYPAARSISAHATVLVAANILLLGLPALSAWLPDRMAGG